MNIGVSHTDLSQSDNSRSVLERQFSKHRVIREDVEKLEKHNQSLREKVARLEADLFESAIGKQISDLTRENFDLFLDVTILSYQHDLLTSQQSGNSHNVTQSANVFQNESNPLNRASPAYYPSNYRINGPSQPYPVQSSALPPYPSMSNFPPLGAASSSRPMQSSHIQRPPSAFCNRQGSVTFLEEVLPQHNQIWLQPVNMYQASQGPPLPPRPTEMRLAPPVPPLHHSRSVPPPPPPRPARSPNSEQRPRSSNDILDESDQKWQCNFCTYNNNGNLTKCEMCFMNRLGTSLGNILTAQYGSLHSLSDLKNNKGSKKRNKRK